MFSMAGQSDPRKVKKKREGDWVTGRKINVAKESAPGQAVPRSASIIVTWSHLKNIIQPQLNEPRVTGSAGVPGSPAEQLRRGASRLPLVRYISNLGGATLKGSSQLILSNLRISGPRRSSAPLYSR
jgi:hypothetical protein